MTDPVPRLTVQLAHERWRDAYDESGVTPPWAAYVPPGTVQVFGVIGAQPDVLAHEALHHVLLHEVGWEATRALDDLPAEKAPIEWLGMRTIPLTARAVEEFQKHDLEVAP